MMERVQLLQPLPRYVSVDRRGGDVGVAEQKLHDAQICAVIDEVRRERMPQRVRRQTCAIDACLDRVALDELPEGLTGKRGAARGDEDGIAPRTAEELEARRSEVPLQPLNRFFA